MKRPDAKLLLDILLSARMALQYLRGVERERFESDHLLQDAVVRRLEIIGQAAGRVSPDTMDAYPGIPWRAMVGMRNRIAHEYFRLDLEVIWQVVKGDLPDLVRKLEPLIPDEHAS